MDSDILLEAQDISHLVSPLAILPKVIPNFRPRPHQKLISDAIVDALEKRGPRFIAVSVPPQYGKALCLDTPIPTPSGWTTMGEIRVGDEVFDDQGQPTKVVAATPVQYDRPCYAVRFDDKEVIVADAEHIWRVNLNRHQADKANTFTFRNTKYLAEGKNGKGRKRGAMVHNAQPLQLPYKPLLIAPYVLGLWLGDGSSADAGMTSDVADRMELFCYVQGEGYYPRQGSGLHWSIEGLGRQLKKLNLVKNKHIPPEYLRASATQRLELLQGLVDTDGHVAPKGIIEFTTTREVLAEGVIELVHSLGVKTKLYKGRATIGGKDCGPKWRVVFFHPEGARLLRKRSRCRKPYRRANRFCDAIEVPSVPVRCIQVENESGMFLAGRSMIPTHNSTVTSIGAPLWWLELHALEVVQGGLVGIVSYEDGLAQSWSKTIRETIQASPDSFASKLKKDSRAASFWETEAKSGIIAVGISGTIVGRPISLLVIDDPTKNDEQAASEKHREQVWNFWQAVGVGRLQPWTIVIVTMTRWRDDDLIGRLMSREFPGNPDKWRYIRIPAISDPTEEMPDPLGRPEGEPLLRPQADQTIEEATLELQEVKESISQYHWHTIWLQSPQNPDGAILFADKWRYWGGDLPADERYDLPMDFEQVVMSWDMAFKDLKTSDWVVGGLWGRNEMDFYLLELIRARLSFTDTCARVNSFAKTSRYRYPKATSIIIEDKANGPAVMDQIRSKVGGLVEFDPGDYGSKIARAQAIQPLLVGGNLYIPAPSEKPWVREYIKECGDFPNATHDDQVDMTTQAILHMLKYKFEPVEMVTGEDIDFTNLRATDVR